MNVVDSSGWREYFTDEANANFFAPAIENTRDLIVPAINLYEVFKRVHQQRGENDALKAIAQMARGQIVEVDMPLALRAAKLSIEYSLPMADSLILATVRAYQATFWTQDDHFKVIQGVQYVEKRR
ncbi:MAG: type II toxin-antitoxin system VapC family toxin [Acidobacteria bacterium]|nr:type II toxin-antitoxin system VapC family toxin [Acidobacteriota bacterium]MBI3657449.1 type II toxin-antitoxin system VapC family toxin [Acidobacteriota bacterium]